MEIWLSLAVAVLFGAAAYLLMDRHLVRVLLGVALLGNAVNLALFLAGDLTRGAPPIVPEGEPAPTELVANALPQALVLTAIVIGFGLFAFALALIYRSYRALGTVDSDAMRLAEPVDDQPAPAAPEPEART